APAPTSATPPGSTRGTARTPPSGPNAPTWRNGAPAAGDPGRPAGALRAGRPPRTSPGTGPPRPGGPQGRRPRRLPSTRPPAEGGRGSAPPPRTRPAPTRGEARLR